MGILQNNYKILSIFKKCAIKQILLNVEYKISSFFNNIKLKNPKIITFIYNSYFQKNTVDFKLSNVVDNDTLVVKNHYNIYSTYLANNNQPFFLTFDAYHYGGAIYIPVIGNYASLQLSLARTSDINGSVKILIKKTDDNSTIFDKSIIVKYEKNESIFLDINFNNMDINYIYIYIIDKSGAYYGLTASATIYSSPIQSYIIKKYDMNILTPKIKQIVWHNSSFTIEGKCDYLLISIRPQYNKYAPLIPLKYLNDNNYYLGTSFAGNIFTDFASNYNEIVQIMDRYYQPDSYILIDDNIKINPIFNTIFLPHPSLEVTISNLLYMVKVDNNIDQHTIKTFMHTQYDNYKHKIYVDMDVYLCKNETLMSDNVNILLFDNEN